jgi:hypothetical protein
MEEDKEEESTVPQYSIDEAVATSSIQMGGEGNGKYHGRGRRSSTSSRRK